MGKQAHLGLSLSPNFYLRPWKRIIEWSLSEHDEKLGQISEFQHAYGGSKGTDTALSTLVNLIESAILRKQLCLVISVDIKGAFDNLAFMSIEKAMKDNNYPPLMIRWFMNFLKNRIAIAEVLGHSSTNGVLKSRYQKMNIFCVHLGKDSTTLCRWFVLSTLLHKY